MEAKKNLLTYEGLQKLENELEELLVEYTKYREEHKLWESIPNYMEYKFENGFLQYKKTDEDEWKEVEI